MFLLFDSWYMYPRGKQYKHSIAIYSSVKDQKSMSDCPDLEIICYFGSCKNVRNSEAIL